MGSGSSHCNRCQQDVDSNGNVHVGHQFFCDLWYGARQYILTADRMYDLKRTIESQNRTIEDLRCQVGSKWKLNQEVIRLKEQNEDFRKANKDLARKNRSLQITVDNERKVMYQSHQDLRKQATDLKNNLERRIYAYKDELDQANEKIILGAEKIQNQRNQLRNLNQKQEKLVLRSVFNPYFRFQSQILLSGR